MSKKEESKIAKAFNRMVEARASGRKLTLKERLREVTFVSGCFVAGIVAGTIAGRIIASDVNLNTKYADQNLSKAPVVVDVREPFANRIEADQKSIFGEKYVVEESITRLGDNKMSGPSSYEASKNSKKVNYKVLSKEEREF